MPNSAPTNNELSPTSYQDNCQKLNYLVSRQKELCSLSENILTAVSIGARMGIDECQHQFKNSRWNCSTFSNTTSIFGGMLAIKSRETAYVYAISSAGVAYAITRACSRGELNECSCDTRVRLKKPRKNWQWGGCSEDIHFGESFSKDFVDAKENVESAEGLMNLHNNEAGRRSIRSRMQRVCKCHGMSGSCSIRVCWRKLPSFRTVGDALLARFEGASHVKLVEKKRKKIKKLRAVSKDLKPPNKTDLVYLQESPDYCEHNETLGIFGTRGRLCNRTSLGLDGCRLLCCGRGYQTRLKDIEEKCHCKFVWCCNVVCEMCQYRKDEHICN
ncbi:protein Wnt-4 precursor, putative [Pediculus humanus corporis]|uniref:Protein Wnt n=1 Tax=Pediculus humanus subsp. corporis TaxID=121224 RepID=E0VAF9_PEDHC|nr:protein Wnt-4 precursor, putative [Pediculus humanus corporis]EEB10365.1 protein Wnt-4 precursor, putative [Pediculus humanus corporis]